MSARPVAGHLNVGPAASTADLLRASVALDSRGLSALARSLGFVVAPRPPGDPEPESGEASSPPPAAATQAVASQEAGNLAPVPFWRLERVEHLEVETEPAQPAAPPFGELELGQRSFAIPRAPLPIVAWSRLWPHLQAAFHTEKEGRALDTARLIEVWCRGEAPRRLPRRKAAGWSGRVTLLLDRSHRLVPVWRDQDELYSRLCRTLGAGALQVLESRATEPGLWRRGAGKPRRRLPAFAPGEAVLACSDLGSYAGAAERQRWRWLGEALRAQAVRVRALVPSPAGRLASNQVRPWQPIDWEAPGRPPVSPGRPEGRDEFPERSERLLRLLSWALRVEPGLLRQVRHLLPASQADLGTEIDTWGQPQLRGASSIARYLEPGSAGPWRESFGSAPPPLRAAIVAALKRWHGVQAPEIWFLEVLGLAAAGLLPEGLEGEVLRARRFLHRLASTVLAPDVGTGKAHAASLAWLAWAAARIPPELWQDPELGPELTRAWALAAARDPSQGLPAGMPLRWLAAGGPPRAWLLWQKGKEVHVRSGTPERPAGSPLGSLTAGSAEIGLATGPNTRAARLVLEDAQRGSLLPTGPELLLLSDRQELTFRRFERPEWARAAGRDRYGLWVEIEVKGVRHRLRWIPPGRFWMGSPETEQGRWEGEGPRHRVTLTAGYWLGETPCTQALWQAVMGKNPSHFKGPERPVESVSWQDCQTFLERLERLVPGLEPRLPTEAEWEHACRAGTETGTYTGDLEISEGEAALLEPIAWYSANSGAETHPVGEKEANPWGLRDTLGNVWEWCADPWGRYTPGPVTDPLDPELGSDRVIRGGSGGGDEWLVRAAARYWYSPGSRGDAVGFRLARGQGRPHPLGPPPFGSAQGMLPARPLRPSGRGGGRRGPAGDTEPPP
ncbi:MAG TPA: formylglycine-generating enzyme family protein [Thermoanaerobaculia bacterium]|nr:formylglycine-generating enzyme family protein [Thermoanaerobaculia bacterium]